MFGSLAMELEGAFCKERRTALQHLGGKTGVNRPGPWRIDSDQFGTTLVGLKEQLLSV